MFGIIPIKPPINADLAEFWPQTPKIPNVTNMTTSNEYLFKRYLQSSFS